MLYDIGYVIAIQILASWMFKSLKTMVLPFQYDCVWDPSSTCCQAPAGSCLYFMSHSLFVDQLMKKTKHMLTSEFRFLSDTKCNVAMCTVKLFMVIERSYQFIRKQFFKYFINKSFLKIHVGLCDLHKIPLLIKSEINQMYEPTFLLRKQNKTHHWWDHTKINPTGYMGERYFRASSFHLWSPC